MSPDVWMMLGFIAFLALGVPVAFSLGLAGAVGILAGLSPDMLATLGTNTYNGVAKYPLIAIPLFILTGLIFEKSGVALRLVRFAQALIGRRHGGLAMVAVLVCLIMSGMSGSGPADAAAVAMVMLPSMTKAGYPKPFSATLIAASASTAILIPPSIALILYSIVVPGVDLRALFAAGLFPGMLAGLMLLLPAWWIARRNGWEPPIPADPRRATPAAVGQLQGSAAGAVRADSDPGRLAQRPVHAHRGGSGGGAVWRDRRPVRHPRTQAQGSMEPQRRSR